jgi:hypothetical protein
MQFYKAKYEAMVAKVAHAISGRILLGGDLNGYDTFAKREMVEATASATARGEW